MSTRRGDVKQEMGPFYHFYSSETTCLSIHATTTLPLQGEEEEGGEIEEEEETEEEEED